MEANFCESSRIWNSTVFPFWILYRCPKSPCILTITIFIHPMLPCVTIIGRTVWIRIWGQQRNKDGCIERAQPARCHHVYILHCSFNGFRQMSGIQFSKLNSVLVNATITAMYGWIPISSQSHQNPHHPMFLNRHPLHLTEQNSNKRWAW